MRFAGKLALCLMTLCGPSPAQDEPSPLDKDRVGRLEQLAKALEAVVVDRVQSTGDRIVDGRRASRQSELHLRFLVCVSGLENDNKDGVLLFPLQASGFTSIIDPRQDAPEQRTGSDFQKVKLTFQGLIGQPSPKVKIELPDFQHGSLFPALQIARDEIHQRIRQHFPEAEIEGMQKFFEKELEVRNETAEPLTVWIHWRTWAAGGKTDGWVWRPGAPGTAEPLVEVLPARSSRKITVTGRGPPLPLTASRVLIWAESDSGERSVDHQHEGLWLVDRNPQFGGERAYHATSRQLAVHVFRSRPGLREFTERSLQFRNESPEALKVRLRYRTSENGQSVWREAGFNLPAGETLSPLGQNGMSVRASRVYFSAESENRKYERFSKEPLWLVDLADGRRAYRADKIGRYVYTFKQADETADRGTATITAGYARIMEGETQLAIVREHEAFKVVGVRPGWVQVEFTDKAGAKQLGWIEQQQLSIAKPVPNPSPDIPPETLQVTAASTHVLLGSTRIARLTRGQKHRVLENNNGWLRVEVTVNGESRQGWVNAKDVRLTKEN